MQFIHVRVNAYYISMIINDVLFDQNAQKDYMLPKKRASSLEKPMPKSNWRKMIAPGEYKLEIALIGSFSFLIKYSF